MLKLLRSPYNTLTRGISTSTKIFNVEAPKVLVPETPSVITPADIYKDIKFIDTVKPRQHYDPHFVAPVSESVQAKVASPFPNYVQAWLKDFKTNEPLDLLNISSQVFGAPLRRDLIHRAVVFERDGLRQGTQSAKNRAEVSGTGRKAFPQKKRGKARVGSLRAPQFRGGGRAFPPKPRDHSTDLQVKVLHHALRSILSTKYAQNQLIIVDKILPNSPKTKDLASILNAHNWNNSYVIAGEQNDNLLLASKNIEKLLVDDIYSPKVYQMMLHSNLILDLSALAHFEYLLSVE